MLDHRKTDRMTKEKWINEWKQVLRLMKSDGLTKCNIISIPCCSSANNTFHVSNNTLQINDMKHGIYYQPLKHIAQKI